jgi:hypothetical protein
MVTAVVLASLGYWYFSCESTWPQDAALIQFAIECAALESRIRHADDADSDIELFLKSKGGSVLRRSVVLSNGRQCELWNATYPHSSLSQLFVCIVEQSDIIGFGAALADKQECAFYTPRCEGYIFVKGTSTDNEIFAFLDSCIVGDPCPAPNLWSYRRSINDLGAVITTSPAVSPRSQPADE